VAGRPSPPPGRPRQGDGDPRWGKTVLPTQRTSPPGSTPQRESNRVFGYQPSPDRKTGVKSKSARSGVLYIQPAWLEPVPLANPNCLRRWELHLLHQLLRATLSTPPLLVTALSSVFKSRTRLQLEILALRHQIGLLQRSAKRQPPAARPTPALCPRLRTPDPGDFNLRPVRRSNEGSCLDTPFRLHSGARPGNGPPHRRHGWSGGAAAASGFLPLHQG
jgi:hypothetical protein